MKIQLIGDLESDLISLGCKEGQVINAVPDKVSKVGAMQFDVMKNGDTYNCVVWPQNYKVIDK